MNRTKNLRILGIVVFALVAAVFFAPRIAQNPAYHQFADQRTFFGVAHFMDVASNIPFLLAFLFGLIRLSKSVFTGPARIPYLVLLLGIGLTFFGSSYYHLNPTTQAL